MARIEKTVFISYRRTDVYTALAVYENLKNQGFDVFFDYRSISSGDFEQIITANIKARAHFLIILTPTALDRCDELGDWLKREIETAIDEKRNIVPLFFKGFRFGTPALKEKMAGKLKNLSRYNGLNVHEDYFDEAMQRLRDQFLSKPLDTVLHPMSTEVQRVVDEEQSAADKALEQIAKQPEGKPVPSQPASAPTLDPKEEELDRLKTQATRHELMGELWDALQVYYKIKKLDPLFPSVDAKIRELENETRPKPVSVPVLQTSPIRNVKQNTYTPFRVFTIGITAVLIIALCIWGGIRLWNNLSSSTPEQKPATEESTAPTEGPALGIGSTMTGKDGMTMLYVPAGEFTMGSNADDAFAECQKYHSDCQRDWFADQEPPHIVDLDAFWIDQTEVTNAMYAMCVNAVVCNEPSQKSSYTRNNYYGKSEFDNYPVIYVSWNDASTYCSWAARRLPTEAEWEKAARGTNGNMYPWGNTFDGNIVNFCDMNCTFGHANKSFNDGFADTSPVGNYPNGASPYGALDMAGNIWEWVDDWYDAYPGNTTSNSNYGTTYRVLRGGTWSNSNPSVRSTRRYWGNPTDESDDIGFRCASTP